jgi:hypothetical protein
MKGNIERFISGCFFGENNAVKLQLYLKKQVKSSEKHEKSHQTAALFVQASPVGTADY